jgi:hypothetical protein
VIVIATLVLGSFLYLLMELQNRRRQQEIKLWQDHFELMMDWATSSMLKNGDTHGKNSEKRTKEIKS